MTSPHASTSRTGNRKVTDRNVRNGASELAAASLALLRELETNLEAGQKALLARDLDGMAQSTREQMRLAGALDILWRTGATVKESAGACDAAVTAARESEQEQLLLAVERVLHLGRVQAALLVRAQQQLKMIGHLVAGPSASYGPSPAARAAAPAESAATPITIESGDACRA